MPNRHNGQQSSDKLKSHKPLIYMKQMVENAALSSNWLLPKTSFFKKDSQRSSKAALSHKTLWSNNPWQ